MNFNLSDEQKQLADAVRRFVEKDYGFEDRKKNYESAAGYGESAWGSLVELGLTALPVPEAQGGFAGKALDMMVVQQELGRGLVVEPYLATVVGAYALGLAGGQDAQLLQFLQLLQTGRRHHGQAEEEFTAVGVDAEVLQERGRLPLEVRLAVAHVGDGAAAKVQRLTGRVGDDLHAVRVEPLLPIAQRRGERRHHGVGVLFQQDR